jgi:ubiquinone/menaquinone biosynthesis C-methylase UbiE
LPAAEGGPAPVAPLRESAVVVDARRFAMTAELDDFKKRQRATWEAGDFATLAERIADVGELVAGRAGIEPGMRVLDVACGAGNAAIPAARAGGRVTGLDLAPKLLEQGRAKAENEGLEIEWLKLPFEDGSFDRVLSTFGHMFAPRHRQVADEMSRACRKGGAIVTATWTAEGVFGRVSEASAPFMPPLPDYASPPVLWGSEGYVRELFGAVATDFEFERHINWIEDESVETFADTFMEKFPPMVTAQAMLGARFQELRERIVHVWRDANQADDGSLRLPQEYLLSIVRL